MLVKSGQSSARYCESWPYGGVSQAVNFLPSTVCLCACGCAYKLNGNANNFDVLSQTQSLEQTLSAIYNSTNTNAEDKVYDAVIIDNIIVRVHLINVKRRPLDQTNWLGV